MTNQQLGRLGEDAASKLLSHKGYRILCRNFSCRAGEIDIVAVRGATIHFIEVKTRQGDLYGRPADSVTYRKKGHLKTAAQYYLNATKRKGWRQQPYQFDVVEIEIHHICDIL